MDFAVDRVTVDGLVLRRPVSDADLRAYYDSRKTDFRILEDQKKIRYVFIDQAKVGEKIEISDADLRAEYDQLSPENKQAGCGMFRPHRQLPIVGKQSVQPGSDVDVRSGREDHRERRHSPVRRRRGQGQGPARPGRS